MRKILYLTRSSARKAAGEYAEEAVSLWSGSCSAYEVQDSRGQRLGVFGYWTTEEDGQ